MGGNDVFWRQTDPRRRYSGVISQIRISQFYYCPLLTINAFFLIKYSSQRQQQPLRLTPIIFSIFFTACSAQQLAFLFSHKKLEVNISRCKLKVKPDLRSKSSISFIDCSLHVLASTANDKIVQASSPIPSFFCLSYFYKTHRFIQKANMNLADKAEQMAEEKIFEEGGYTALWKYKMVRMMKGCGCM